MKKSESGKKKVFQPAFGCAKSWLEYTTVKETQNV